MHIQRLTALADLLDVTEPEKFELTTWHCDTTACAVGTAALHPDFNRQGLHLRRNCIGVLLPTYDRGDGSTTLVNWAATQAFFDLSYAEATHLFHPGSYRYYKTVKPAGVAARIRDLISRQGV